MMQPALPQELLDRFEAVSNERLARIDAAWSALARGERAAADDGELLHDVRSLKGDAKSIGLIEASMMCQRLEDLLSIARSRAYRVHEDVAVAVTLSVRVLAMLVDRGGSAVPGPTGLLKHLEAVTSDWLRRSSEGPERSLSIDSSLRVPDRRAMSSAVRMSNATTAVYLEHLRAHDDETRRRLRFTFETLLAGGHETSAVSLEPLVQGQVTAARELARGLGKLVTVEVPGEAPATAPEAAEALGFVLAQATRIAVEQSLEPPEVRRRAGKPETGTLRIGLAVEDAVVVLTVEDDGAGIDLEGMRAHDSVAELGGRLRVETARGKGTRFYAEIPDARGAIDVIVLEGSRSDLRFAVPAAFGVRRAGEARGIALEDVLGLPGRDRPGPTSAVTVNDGGTSLTLLVGDRRELKRALRRCPTGPDELVEIVWVEGREVILVRPDVLEGGATETRNGGR